MYVSDILYWQQAMFLDLLIGNILQGDWAAKWEHSHDGFYMTGQSIAHCNCWVDPLVVHGGKGVRGCLCGIGYILSSTPLGNSRLHPAMETIALLDQKDILHSDNIRTRRGIYPYNSSHHLHQLWRVYGMDGWVSTLTLSTPTTTMQMKNMSRKRPSSQQPLLTHSLLWGITWCISLWSTQ